MEFQETRGGIEPSRAGSWLGSVKLVKFELSPGSAWCYQNTEMEARGSAREARSSLDRLAEPAVKNPPPSPDFCPDPALTFLSSCGDLRPLPAGEEGEGGGSAGAWMPEAPHPGKPPMFSYSSP
jgi:hypothetical protein